MRQISDATAVEICSAASMAGFGFKRQGEIVMLYPRAFSNTFIASAFVIVGALAAFSVSAQTPPAPVKPYKTVKVTPPAPMTDASFTAFRGQLTSIAQKKDRAALARLVAANFFWIPSDKDIADKSKPAIDNLAKALGLDGKDAYGWFTLTFLSAETTAAPDPQHQGVICAPAPPTYDEKEFEQLLNATQTDPVEWFYPIRNGVEVRSGPQQNATVAEKLGLHVVRVLHEDQPAGDAVVKVATPSGKTGYAASHEVRDLDGLVLCYVKEGAGWKIAGYFGGDAGGN